MNEDRRDALEVRDRGGAGPGAPPVAWIIGATGELGRATARVFASRGWRLALGARSRPALETLQAALAAQADSEGLAVGAFDAADPEAVRSALEDWERYLGVPRACLHLAGGYAGGRGIEAWGAQDWHAMMTINLFGPAVVLPAAFARMAASGRGGALVAVGALAGIDPRAGSVPYGVSKAALLHLVRGLAVEGAAHGIRANALIPAILDTEANRAAMPSADRSRWISLESAARALFYLASGADGVTGSFLRM